MSGFCHGSGTCIKCGRRYTAGDIQLCRRGGLPKPRATHPCIHLGEPTGEEVPVQSCGCRSERMLTAVFECDLHRECTQLGLSKLGHRYCNTCSQYEAEP